MIKEAFGTGSTIDEAKEAALKELNAPEDADVKYDVIEMPKAKVFGLFGGSPAKMRAYYEVEDEIVVDTNETFAKAKDYILTILKSLGIDEAEIEIEADDEDVRISISCGDDYGSVIGRRGETLDAIQYLTRLVINRGSEEYKRVSINVGNYREKRENTLRALARKNAAKVRKYGRNVVLEPMNPYERRIIHTTVQDIEGVTSHSVGSDGDRKVVITLEEGVKPTNGGSYNNRGRGGYNKGGNRGGYRNGGNRGGYRRESSDAPAAPARAPRSDSAGSLYGKIEINKD
ncbi:MAG: RNA-binding cell elongation regulator Jag/EloR [Acutalibacteraceae bacterium]|nr:RNA-binding cell elongation regulator Jag/EloR [Acutalibacteraceae bacterium]